MTSGGRSLGICSHMKLNNSLFPTPVLCFSQFAAHIFCICLPWIWTSRHTVLAGDLTYNTQSKTWTCYCWRGYGVHVAKNDSKLHVHLKSWKIDNHIACPAPGILQLFIKTNSHIYLAAGWSLSSGCYACSFCYHCGCGKTRSRSHWVITSPIRIFNLVWTQWWCPDTIHYPGFRA